MKILKTLSIVCAISVIFLSGCAKDCCSNCTLSKVEPKALKLSVEVEKQYSVNKNFKTAFDYLKKTDLTKVVDGKYSIDGDNVFVIISDSKKRQQKDAFLEAHKNYIDLQYIIKGKETIGLKSTAECKSVKDAYSQKSDIMFFNDSYNKFVNLSDGEFIILCPKDAHAPCIGDGIVRKAVFKIKVCK